MKTPIEELIEHFTDAWSSPGDLWKPDKVIEKIESMLEKEKEHTINFAYKCRNVMAADEFAITKWYEKTFNTKER